jgi:hypothetical protein
MVPNENQHYQASKQQLVKQKLRTVSSSISWCHMNFIKCGLWFHLHDSNSRITPQADQHSLDNFAADIQPLDGLPCLDLLEQANPLLCDRF